MTKQEGFTLPAAIFLLVILALGTAFIVGVSARTQTVSIIAIQNERAFLAAKSGLDWAIYQVTNTNNCPTTPTTLNLTQEGLANYSTTITACTATIYTEGSSAYTIFKITSTGQKGIKGSADYVSRQWSAIVTNAS